MPTHARGASTLHEELAHTSLVNLQLFKYGPVRFKTQRKALYDAHRLTFNLLSLP